MKILGTFVLLLTCSLSCAGDYYVPSPIDTYDADSGLYFKAVEKVQDGRGFMGSLSSEVEVLNINVFDPASGKSRLLFKGSPGGRVMSVLFESAYEDGSIRFTNEEYSSFVENNKGVPKRALKDKVLVSVESPDKKETYLFVSGKRTGQLARIAVIPNGTRWHIDVKNSKIRVVHQTGNGLRMESYEW